MAPRNDCERKGGILAATEFVKFVPVWENALV
jgi:hypothetical protein